MITTIRFVMGKVSVEILLKILIKKTDNLVYFHFVSSNTYIHEEKQHNNILKVFLYVFSQNLKKTITNFKNKIYALCRNVFQRKHKHQWPNFENQLIL